MECNIVSTKQDCFIKYEISMDKIYTCISKRESNFWNMSYVFFKHFNMIWI